MFPVDHVRPRSLFAICALAVVGCSGGVVPLAPPPFDAADHEPEVLAVFSARQDAVLAAPEDARERVKLGLAFEAYGMLEQAEQSFAQAMQLAPADARATYHAARMAAALGDPATALTRIDRVLAAADDYVPAHLHRGGWLLETGQAAAAAAAFESAGALSPDLLAADLGLARAFLQQDRPADAAALLATTRSRHPADPYVTHLLATALRRAGRGEQADRLPWTGVPLPEPFDDPWAEEANAYRVGFAADLKWANALLAAGRFDEAIAILERLRDRHPRDVSVLSNLGAAYLDSGRVDEGREALGAALEVEPDHFSTHLNLSALEERSGDLPAALEHADAAIRGNPYLAAAHEKRGLLLARARRFDEARRALETAVELDAERATSWMALGLVHGQQRRWAAAATALEEAARRSPGDVRAWIGLCRAALESGDRDRARAAERRATSLRPDHPALPDLRRRIADGGDS